MKKLNLLTLTTSQVPSILRNIKGTKDLVEVQNDELNTKKIYFRLNNEKYLRDHPELNQLISVFLFKVLEEKPDNILEYAGKFFD